MPTRLRSPRLISIPFCCALLAACAAPTPGPTSSPTPTSTPEPDLSIAVEAELAPSTATGEWLVLGIAQSDGQPVASPRVVIVVRDSAGEEIARRTVPVPIDPLPASVAWPFREPFRPAETPGSVEAMLLGSSAAETDETSLTGRVLRTFLDAQGRTVALGSLSNRASTPAEAARLRLLGRDSAGRMREVLDVEAGADRIEANDAVPFLASLPAGTEDYEWEVFPIAAAAGPRLSVAIRTLLPDRDDQGNPFVTAGAENNSKVPLRLSLTAVARVGDDWLLGESLAIPVPLAPGDLAPFTLRVPGVGLSPEDEVEWEIAVRAQPTEAGPVSIPSEVIGYESLGSTLLLRVRLTGVDRMVIEHPSAAAKLLDDEGRIVSAGWNESPEPLAPGESTEVTLALPLPADFDLTLGQLDVHGSGVPGIPAAP